MVLLSGSCRGAHNAFLAEVPRLAWKCLSGNLSRRQREITMRVVVGSRSWNQLSSIHWILLHLKLCYTNKYKKLVIVEEAFRRCVRPAHQSIGNVRRYAGVSHRETCLQRMSFTLTVAMGSYTFTQKTRWSNAARVVDASRSENLLC